MTKYNIITTTGLIITTILILWLTTSSNFSCIRKGECIVECKEYDSLVSIANRPPKVDTLIQHDTIKEVIIKWRDKLIPTYLDSNSVAYSDTVNDKRLKLIVNDTLQKNRIVYRQYDYEVYADTVRVTTEVEKPVYRDTTIYVTKSKRGLYYGGTVGTYSSGALITGDLTYISRKDEYVKISIGGLGDINQQKIFPLFELGIGKKF